MINDWGTLLNTAKKLENRLQGNIDSYSVVAQKISSDFLCDEENTLLGSQDEMQLANAIEVDLTELSGCITLMKNVAFSQTVSNGNSNQEALLKRYNEIYYDFTNEFKNTSAAIKRKRESMELFQTSSRNSSSGSLGGARSDRDKNGNEIDPSMASLLRERSGISSSMKAIQEVMSQAFETRSSLNNQRNTLTGADGGLSSITANSPTLHRLMDGIQRKNSKENMVITIFVSLLLCFTIWYASVLVVCATCVWCMCNLCLVYVTRWVFLR